MVLGLMSEHFTSLRCPNSPLVPSGCMGTSRRWNAAATIATLAKLGTFSHISINGFGSCVEHFTPWKCLHSPSKPSGCMGTSGKWNATAGPYSAIATLAELGPFSHIIVNGFGTCVGAFHPLKVPQKHLGTERVYRYQQEMKCYNWTLFCHCRTCQTRYFFSCNCQWFWELCWSISPLGSASAPSWYRAGIWALPKDEML